MFLFYFHFREILWATPFETFAISTTIGYRAADRRSWQGNAVKTLALFHVLPLRFYCMFDITRDVSAV
jgi:hypothetical protein